MLKAPLTPEDINRAKRRNKKAMLIVACFVLLLLTIGVLVTVLDDYSRTNATPEQAREEGYNDAVHTLRVYRGIIMFAESSMRSAKESYSPECYDAYLEGMVDGFWVHGHIRREAVMAVAETVR